MVVVFTFIFLLIPNTKVNKVFFLVGGGFVVAAGAFITGPSLLFNFPDSLGLIDGGLVVSGLGKALLKSYAVPYAMKSGMDEFSDSKEEAERKIPLLITLSYGITAFVIPLSMAGIYNRFGFRVTMDTLGVVVTVYAIGFAIHAAKFNWGKKVRRMPSMYTEAEDQGLLSLV